MNFTDFASKTSRSRQSSTRTLPVVLWAATALIGVVNVACSDDASDNDSHTTSTSTTSSISTTSTTSTTSTASNSTSTATSSSSESSAIEEWEVDFYPGVWTVFEQTLQPRVRRSGSMEWAVQGCGIDGFVPILGNRHTIRIEKTSFADPMIDGCGWHVRFIEQIAEERVPSGTEFEIVRLRGEHFISGVAGWSLAGLNFECASANLCPAVQEASSTAKDLFYTTRFAIPSAASESLALRELTQVP